MAAILRSSACNHDLTGTNKMILFGIAALEWAAMGNARPAGSCFFFP